MPRTLALAALALIAAAATTRAAADSPAIATIRRLNEALGATSAQAEQLGYEGRLVKLEPAVATAFDLDFMGEKAIGRHWKPLAEADRRQWLALFRKFTTANYAANLDRSAGQRFEVVGEEPGPNETVLVKTRVSATGIDPVDVSYRLREAAPAWKIVDVYYKGTVSELALRRADFTAVLDRDGFPGLVVSVEAKLAELAAGRGAADRR